jgi:arylsulfatase A-like enzyme
MKFHEVLTQKHLELLRLKVWSRRDLLWTAGLWIPIAFYALILKTLRLHEAVAGASTIDLVKLYASDVLILLVWLAIALSLRAVARAPWARAGAAILLLLGFVVYALVLLGSYGYFRSTGEALDFANLKYAVTRLGDTGRVIASGSTFSLWLGFGLTITMALVLSLWLSRSARDDTACTPFTRNAAVLILLALAAPAVLRAARASYRGSVYLTRDPFLHVLLTVRDTVDNERDPAILAQASQRPKGPSSLRKRPGSPTKNIVILMLESTAAWATSLYGGAYDTTPFMVELAKHAIVGERAYAIVPHSSKAMVSTLCGIEPRPGSEMIEAFDQAIPGRCLASLLSEQGYRTALFMSATSQFENSPALARNMEFQEFFSGEHMAHDGLTEANYFGFEDRILLGPTRSWLDANAGRGPFFLAYLTNTPHHDYLAPRTYGFVQYVQSDIKNRYLNSVRYEDHFLRDLFAEFESHGLLDNTVFILIGDHGEGFGEHGLYVHDDIIYEEAVRVPLVIVDGSKRAGERLPGPFTQFDVAPTVLDLAGFDVLEGSYVGRSLLAPPEPRVVFLSCLTDRRCAARIEGSRKFIHNFGRMPDELYDLSTDPGERSSLAAQQPADAKRSVEEILNWYRVTRAMYLPARERAHTDFIADKPPAFIEHPRRIRIGDTLEYLGWSIDHEPIRPGDWVTITYYLHVLSPLLGDEKWFLFAEGGERTYNWSHQTIGRMYPEERWQAGQYLMDVFRAKTPESVKQGVVIVRGGLSRAGGKRIKSDSPDGSDAPILVEIPVADLPPD